MVSVTPVLGVMLGLAVGIDYSLFIVHRHRRQLKEGYAAARVDRPRHRHLRQRRRLRRLDRHHRAPGAQRDRHPVPRRDGHASARPASRSPCSIALTFTPALLGLDRRARASRHASAPRSRPRPARPSRRPSARCRPGGRSAASCSASACSRVLAVPALSMRLGLPDGSSEPPDSTQYQAYATVAEKFGAGVNGPLLVVADLPGSPTQDDGPRRPGPHRPAARRSSPTSSRSPRSAPPTDGTHDRLPGRPGGRPDERLDGAARQGPPGGLAARRRRPDRAWPARPAATSTSPRSWRTPCRSTSASSSACRC